MYRYVKALLSDTPTKSNNDDIYHSIKDFVDLRYQCGKNVMYFD